VKIPEPLFAVINPIVRLLLNTPFHFFWSNSLMLITFSGRKSGRSFTTPVRYIADGEVVRCFTSATNQWWRNLRGGADVVLRLHGQNARYHAIAIENDPPAVKTWLTFYLAKFPQDAEYHNIRIGRDKRLVSEDLEKASTQAVVVELSPLN
jgi:hypothetical protein